MGGVKGYHISKHPVEYTHITLDRKTHGEHDCIVDTALFGWGIVPYRNI